MSGDIQKIPAQSTVNRRSLIRLGSSPSSRAPTVNVFRAFMVALKSLLLRMYARTLSRANVRTMNSSLLVFANCARKIITGINSGIARATNSTTALPLSLFNFCRSDLPLKGIDLPLLGAELLIASERVSFLSKLFTPIDLNYCLLHLNSVLRELRNHLHLTVDLFDPRKEPN